MKINQKELTRMGTPKSFPVSKKKISKEERVLKYLKKHGETSFIELDRKCNLYGHASRIVTHLDYIGKISLRTCETGKCRFYKYIHD